MSETYTFAWPESSVPRLQTNTPRGNQPAARHPVTEIAKDRRGQEIAEHEGRSDVARLFVAKMQLGLQRRQHGGEQLPVEVVEEVQPGEHHQRTHRPD